MTDANRIEAILENINAATADEIVELGNFVDEVLAQVATVVICRPELAHQFSSCITTTSPAVVAALLSRLATCPNYAPEPVRNMNWSDKYFWFEVADTFDFKRLKKLSSLLAFMRTVSDFR